MDATQRNTIGSKMKIIRFATCLVVPSFIGAETETISPGAGVSAGTTSFNDFEIDALGGGAHQVVATLDNGPNKNASSVSCDNAEISGWESLTDEDRRTFWRRGITKLMWDRSDEKQPYLMSNTWDDLEYEYQESLKLLGWDAAAYLSSEIPPTSRLMWDELSDEQKVAANILGYQASDWFLMSMQLADDFVPVKLALDIPELRKFGFDYYKTLTDVEVAVADGATVNDDMFYMPEQYTMASYVESALAGSTRYLKYEDYDGFKKKLPSEIGASIIQYLGGALKASPEMREKGHWDDSYDNRAFSDYNWFLCMGGTNTSTSLHYDVDAVNFLYVVEGEKRVVVIPNDERTVGQFSCIPGARGNACWPGVDVLYTDKLPEHAVEIIVGAGEGISIPELSWHAVQNVEPTVAYGFRVNQGFWDQPWSLLSEEEKESVRAVGFTEASWSVLLDVGRDFEKFDTSTGDEQKPETVENKDEENDGDDLDLISEYDDLSWTALPEDYRVQMQLLGYSEAQWEIQNSYLDMGWEDLPFKQSEAIRILECSEKKASFLCFVSKWQELSDREKWAAKLLGYGEAGWDELVAVHSRS